MPRIIGNTTAMPNPRPDWNQTDETRADYIKNKPTDLVTKTYVDESVQEINNTIQEIENNKLDASMVTSDVQEGNDNPVSSGGVYTAIQGITGGAGIVNSVNGKIGEVTLSASDVGALPADTKIPEVPSTVSAFTNDAGYIKSTEVDSVPVNGSQKPVSSGGVYTALEEAGKVKSVNGKTGEVILSASDIGADKEGSANTALTNAKTYTNEQIAALINSAPTTLDTLGEIADAMTENHKVVEALDKAIGSKSEVGHTHNDLYYTESEINNLLSGKSNTNHDHDGRYYTRESIDSMLEGSSVAGHNHDDRYYTEEETNSLINQAQNNTSLLISDLQTQIETKLAGKSDKTHSHNDLYYTEAETNNLISQTELKAQQLVNNLASQTETKLAEKSDKDHNHGEIYASKEEAEMLRETKSDKDHLHRWDEIKNRPGTDKEELLLTYNLSEPDRDNQGRWCQFFGKAPDVILGETVRVRINFNGTVYERDCKVLSDDGCMYGIPFNNSAYSEETIDDGTCDYDTEPIESGVPSLLLYMVPGQSCELMADRDYTGADIDVMRMISVKLRGDAIYLTDKVEKDSGIPVTSGGVFDALLSAGAGAVTSVNGKTGKINLTASDIGADEKGSASTALTNAKTYTNEQIATLIDGAPDENNTLGKMYTTIEGVIGGLSPLLDNITSELENKADKDHLHSSAIPIIDGGTGATTKEEALVNLGIVSYYGGINIGEGAFDIGGGAAIGYGASTEFGASIGWETQSTTGAAIGSGAKSTANEAVQLGRGTNNTEHSLQFIDHKISNGVGNLYGTVLSLGADTAEQFEWVDGNVNNEDRRGYFVTVDTGEMIRIANSNDDYILGVISSKDISSFISNTAYDGWHDKYLRDVYGDYILEKKLIPEKKDETTGRIIVPEHTKMVRVISPEYDETKEYIPRIDRPEWAVICFMGQIVVNDDGTCKVDEYCKVSDNGGATAAEKTDPIKYRVIKRIDESHIKIIFK